MRMSVGVAVRVAGSVGVRVRLTAGASRILVVQNLEEHVRRMNFVHLAVAGSTELELGA
jgi:hypothetical protein